MKNLTEPGYKIMIDTLQSVLSLKLELHDAVQYISCLPLRIYGPLMQLCCNPSEHSEIQSLVIQ